MQVLETVVTPAVLALGVWKKVRDSRLLVLASTGAPDSTQTSVEESSPRVHVGKGPQLPRKAGAEPGSPTAPPEDLSERVAAVLKGLTPEAAWRGIQRLGMMKEWMLLTLLACPGK